MLDVNLNGTKSYPVSERLAACGIPFVFSTGYSDHALGDAHADRPVLKKPFQYPELASALTRLLSNKANMATAAGTLSPTKGRDHVTVKFDLCHEAKRGRRAHAGRRSRGRIGGGG